MQYIRAEKHIHLNREESPCTNYEEIGTTWMLSMNKGDTLQLKIASGTLYSDFNVNKVFTGKFIRII